MRWWVRSWVIACCLATAGCGASKPAQDADSAPSPGREQELAAIRRLLEDNIALQKRGQHAAAEPGLRGALERSRALEPVHREALSVSLGELASCLVSLKRTAEARPLLAEALALWQPGSAEADRRIFVLQIVLGESHRYDKNNELAVAPFRAAIEAASRHEAERAVALVEAATRLASTLSLLKRHDEAIAILDHALKVAQRYPSSAQYSTRIALELAGAYYSAGKHDRALELLDSFQTTGRTLRTSDMTFSDVPARELFAPAPPPATPRASTPAPSSGNVQNTARRVAEMRADFRKCYQAALVEDAQLLGSVRIRIEVGADGRVTESKGLGFGLPVELVDCVLRRAAATEFDAPEGGKAVIMVPVTFGKE
ncbi:MAG TPA: tetratricopeptide repeat protein [Polyangiaceae bacterium]|nr:tetratricopeptide repeat protein [Polyangiaceae bacterium]